MKTIVFIEEMAGELKAQKLETDFIKQIITTSIRSSPPMPSQMVMPKHVSYQLDKRRMLHITYREEPTVFRVMKITVERILPQQFRPPPTPPQYPSQQ